MLRMAQNGLRGRIRGKLAICELKFYWSWDCAIERGTMPYKDKDKQKEANKLAAQRRRDKGMTNKGMTKQGMTQDPKVIPDVTPKAHDGSIDVRTLAQADAACGEYLTHGLPANYGQPDCECKHCRANRAHGSKHTINHGPYKPFVQLKPGEVNRVSLPGDVDYDGIVGVSR